MRVRYAVAGFFAALAIGSAGGAVAYRAKLPPFGLINYVAAKSRPYDPSRSPHYRARVSYFEVASSAVEIVMLGDSITEGGEWDRLLPGVSVSNQGISGDGVAGIAKRLDAVLRSSPRAVFIMAGTNDISNFQDVETIIDNFRDVIEGLGNTMVLLQSILFTNDNDKNTTITLVNQGIEALCAEFEYCKFVDLNPYLAPTGKLLPPDTFDGTHLSGTGYLKWADVISPMMIPEEQHGA